MYHHNTTLQAEGGEISQFMRLPPQVNVTLYVVEINLDLICYQHVRAATRIINTIRLSSYTTILASLIFSPSVAITYRYINFDVAVIRGYQCQTRCDYEKT